MMKWKITLYFYPYAGGKRICESYEIIANDKNFAIEVAKDTFFSELRPDGELHVHPHNKGYVE